MKKLIIISGAGVSAESGLATFRDHNGLWNNYRIEEVATPEAWHRNPQLVLDFYNMRRRDVLQSQPNKAHILLADLEQYFDVEIITQNVDNLHEQAGSSQVLHLHGELLKVRSTQNPDLIYPWEKDLSVEDKAEDGAQLRPHIVWFGEGVPAIPQAAELVQQADMVLIIGTSLQVYPAAGLIEYAPVDCPIYIIDPQQPHISFSENIHFIQEKATVGMEILFEKLVGS